MAFLCPARIRRAGRRRRQRRYSDAPPPGRITGSDSIDTLHRVELEKQNLDLQHRVKMLVIHDFVPCVEDELEVEKGQQVAVLYQENDWLYVIADNGQEGFIPKSYCIPLGSTMDDLHINGRHSNRNSHYTDSSYASHASLKRATSTPSLHESHLIQSNNPRPGGFQKPHTSQVGQYNVSNAVLNRQVLLQYKPSGLTVGLPQSYPPQQLSKAGTGMTVAQVYRPVIVSKDKPSSSSSSTYSQPVAVSDFKSKNVNEIKNTENNVSSTSNTNRREQRSNNQDKSLTPQQQRPYQAQRCLSPLDIDPDSFEKKSYGRYIVLFKFVGQEENDVSVERGEFVTILNKDDKDWYWVVRSDYEEGFVPSPFLCPAEGQTLDMGKLEGTTKEPDRTKLEAPGPEATKLMCVYNFRAQVDDDLSADRGDLLYADLQEQSNDGWLWAYSSVRKKYGYIPRAYTKVSQSPVSLEDAQGRNPFISP